MICSINGWIKLTLVAELQKTPVVEVLSHKASIRSGTSIELVFKKMKEIKVGSIAIVDDKNRLLGIFTDRNILNRVILAKCSINEPIDNVMIKSAHSISSNAMLDQAFVIMYKHNHRYLPVVDGKDFLGFIEARTFVSFLSEIYGTTISTVAPGNIPSKDFREGA